MYFLVFAVRFYAHCVLFIDRVRCEYLSGRVDTCCESTQHWLFLSAYKYTNTHTHTHCCHSKTTTASCCEVIKSHSEQQWLTHNTSEKHFKRIHTVWYHSRSDRVLLSRMTNTLKEWLQQQQRQRQQCRSCVLRVV